MPSRLTVVLVLLLLATPAVAFWLWLVVVPARMAKLCPEECWCDPGGYYVDCTSSSLNSIPLIFPTNVRELIFDGNSITSLEKGGFISRGLTELEKLTVRRCELRKIEFGAFSGLTELTFLSVSGNEISEIIPGIFENLSRLERLDLTFNRIELLEVGAFSGLINLKHVELSINGLKYLHPDVFSALPNLIHLSLSYNSGLIIPTDSHFINSHSLRRLDISACRVSSVSVETFAEVTALERLDLRVNNLKSVDVNILKALPKLLALYLYGNPLQCDCQLQEMWRWCQDHNIETATTKVVPECDTPSEVHGIWWGVLEKGQCLQNGIKYYGDYKNTIYNHTVDQDTEIFITVYDYYYKLLFRVQVPVCAVLFTFGTSGNVILLIIIISNKDMRTVPNIFIVNLAISDIISLIIHFSAAYEYQNPSNEWKYGDFICKFFPFCYRMSVGLTAYSVAVLSFQRYNVTADPFHIRFSSQTTWRVTVATVCGVWIVAAFSALPSAFSENFCLGCVYTNCKTYYKMVVLFELLVSYVIPLCVIAFCYIMTARHLVKSAVPISDDTRHPHEYTRKTTARILLGLSVVFVISLVPYHIVLTYSLFSDFMSHFGVDHSFGPLIYLYTIFFSICLLLINCCLNSVALFCTSRAFRRKFKWLFIYYCKIRTRVSDFELTTRK
jgi:hypothetical protein